MADLLNAGGLTDARILRGEMTCSTCRKPIAEGAARAIVYFSPHNFQAACVSCISHGAQPADVSASGARGRIWRP